MTGRFAIARHTGGPAGDHFDLYLESEGALRTWRIASTEFGSAQPATKIRDHQLKYLIYEGPVSDERGTVALWDRGDYVVDVWKPAAIQAALNGGRMRARIRLSAESQGGDTWSVVDPSVALRQSVASFLRSVQLDPAPDPALDAVGTALMAEEQRIVAAIEKFRGGGDVDWKAAATDASLREKLRSARSRWRHPWIEQAEKYASGLDALVKQMKP